MSQMSLFPQGAATLSVSEINAHIRTLLEGDSTLQDVWVQGEISNISTPKSGHMYFTLKDASASLRGVMWRTQVARLTYQPREGDALEVHGSISVYEVGGQYQLYADDLRPTGAGALYQEFLRLKEKLEGEGLFDPERKRAIPSIPGVIGIVTSPSGAAIRDMLNTLRRRYPLVRVVLAPAAVQGDAAPAEIISGIQRLNEYSKPDVILVGRGGGSIEDLWAFNDEGVARTIAASDAPVISAVGHETDFTIADFVADLRAPTPTAAAELATPDKIDLQAGLRETQLELGKMVIEKITEWRYSLNDVQYQLGRLSPEALLRSGRQRLDEYQHRLGTAMLQGQRVQRTRLEGLAQKLTALDPQSILGRGFSLVTNEKGELVKSIKDVNKGDSINVRVQDGEFGAEVKG